MTRHYCVALWNSATTPPPPPPFPRGSAAGVAGVAADRLAGCWGGGVAVPKHAVRNDPLKKGFTAGGGETKESRWSCDASCSDQRLLPLKCKWMFCTSTLRPEGLSVFNNAAPSSFHTLSWGNRKLHLYATKENVFLCGLFLGLKLVSSSYSSFC